MMCLLLVRASSCLATLWNSNQSILDCELITVAKKTPNQKAFKSIDLKASNLSCERDGTKFEPFWSGSLEFEFHWILTSGDT
jgi:hypothetical protein